MAAAAPDGRTFYAVYMTYGKAGGQLWIYRFRLTSARPTAPAPIAGGRISGQDFLGNVGGFAVSPDGSRLALAVASTTTNSVSSGFTCSTLGQDNRQPVKGEGTEEVREIRLASGGGSLSAGPALPRASARLTPGRPVIASRDGRNLITMVPAGDKDEVVTIAMTSGAITGRLGPVPGPVYLGLHLASAPTGRYVLTWEGGNGADPAHGYVHAGEYHPLAPVYPLQYPGGWIQLSW